jgi:hypothetical protein
MEKIAWEEDLLEELDQEPRGYCWPCFGHICISEYAAIVFVGYPH